MHDYSAFGLSLSIFRYIKSMQGPLPNTERCSAAQDGIREGFHALCSTSPPQLTFPDGIPSEPRKVSISAAPTETPIYEIDARALAPDIKAFRDAQ